MHVLGDNDASCLIDMHSIHIYTASEDHNKNATCRLRVLGSNGVEC